MNKIVYNNCFGGFGLSNRALFEICKRKGIPVFFYKEHLDDSSWYSELTYTRISPEEAFELSDFDVSACKVDCGQSFKRKDDICKTFTENYIYCPISSRHDPVLVQVVEELGSKKASGQCAELVIYKTESNMYRIDEYDGSETVYTPDTESWTVIE